MGYGGIVRSVLEVITNSSVAPRSNSAWYTELSQFMNTLETHVEESRGSERRVQAWPAKSSVYLSS